MATQTLRIKRRLAGNPGAPASLASSELAYNCVDQTLYIGHGDNGSGVAQSIVAVGGAAALGDYVTLNSDQTVNGNKTFSGVVGLGQATVTGLALDDLSDLDVQGAISGQVLQYNGEKWAPITQSPDGVLGVEADANSGIYAITTGGDVAIGGVDASSVVKGVVRFANAAEVEAGIAGNLAVTPKDLEATKYVLPAATDSALGGIKVGSGLLITGDGTLSASLQGALVFKGTTDITKQAPAASQGDSYINEVEGEANSSWSGLEGEQVADGALVIYDGTEWATQAMQVDAGVVGVEATSPLACDNTNPAHPLLSIQDATVAQKGAVRLANAADITNGTSNRVVTSDGLKAYVGAPVPVGQHNGDLLVWSATAGAYQVAHVIDGGTF